MMLSGNLKETNKEREKTDDYKQQDVNSVLLSFIKKYEEKHKFNFEEVEVMDKIEQLQEIIAKMWLPFKERLLKFALNKLNEFIMIHIDDKNYEKNITELLNKLLPIIAIYEIFNRPLFESVYPESIPQTKRPWTYLLVF